ncbi:MAG: SDR family NAD(P)-dependent oxidoreductase [Pseudomonadales bacterium]
MNRSILITGCSSGIGLDAAMQLQQRGYQVIATVRNREHFALLQEQGLNHVLQLDLRSSESIYAAVAKTLELTEGKLYALFNNGAYGLPGAVEDLTRDALRRQFETNLFGTHELTRALLPTLLQQPDARIIQCNSVLGIVAMPFRGAYNASKFALQGLTDTLRQEMVGTSVKVISIEPGPILTDFRKNSLRAFREEVDVAASRHCDSYEATLKRLNKEGVAQPFTLGPQAVTKKLIHALESKRPKAHYYVTFPTYLMGFLRRVLGARALDAFLRRAV